MRRSEATTIDNIFVLTLLCLLGSPLGSPPRSQSCTSDSLIHEPLTTSGHLTNVVKILLCYVNGGKTKYFIGTTTLNSLIMIPIPKFIRNGEFEHHVKVRMGGVEWGRNGHGM